MLPPDFAPLVAERLKALQGPVKLDYFHQSDGSIIVPGRQPCPSCPPTLEVLEEIAALHDDLTLRVHDYYSDREAVAKWGAERVPGIVIHGEVNRPIRFYGMPGGMLLWALIDVIVGASGKPASVPTELTALLKKLRARVHARVLASFQHAESAQAAATAASLSLLSDKIDASIYSLEDSADIAMQLQLTRIPLTIVNDNYGFAGVTKTQALAQFCLDTQSRPEKVRPPEVDPRTIMTIEPPKPQPPPGAAGPGGRGPGGRGPGGRGPGGRGPGGRGPAGPPMRRTRGGIILPGQ